MISSEESKKYPQTKKTDPDIGRRFTIGELDFASGSDYVGIGKMICLYYGPTKNGIRPVAELVNCNFWGGHTSLIVALFLNESEAKKCMTIKRLKLYDRRWKKQTEEVKKMIENNHPRFVLGTGT